MRTIKDLAIVQDSSAQFPFSTIQNETDTEQGTPVVREIYGDVLTNIYKLLQVTGIAPTGTEDSDSSQYQILQALKSLPNLLNDIEQVLTLSGLVWSAPFNLSLLPNKYVFVARSTEDYVKGSTYTFKGTGSTVYSFISNGFKAGDEIIVVIDSSAVRAYSLSQSGSSSSGNEIFTVFGIPVSYNDTTKIYYQDEGKLVTDFPSVDYLESTIRFDAGDGTLLVNDIFIIGGKALCICFGASGYSFRQFSLSDFSASTLVTISGFNIPNDNNSPYFFSDGGFIYITNQNGVSANNFSISKITYNTAGTLTFLSTSNMNAGFDKTTNTVVKGGFIYTLVSGQLNKYNLASGVKTDLGKFNNINGQLFSFNNEIYFNSGEVAKKWQI